MNIKTISLIALLPLSMVKISYALSSDDKIQKHEEFLEGIGAYKCTGAMFDYGYEFNCESPISPFNEKLYTSRSLSAYVPSHWRECDRQRHQRVLKWCKHHITQTLKDDPEIVNLMTPEQQTFWQESVTKKAAQVAQEKTLNKINDFFLGQ